MGNASLKSFGVIIAFIVPGFICTWAISLRSDMVASWLTGNPASQISVGGMLLSTILALGCGLIASTVRWMLLDSFHHWTGIRKQPWDYNRLEANISAYQLLEESHYRFYQFYGNSLCALIFAYSIWKITNDPSIGWTDGIAVILALILYLGSRDTLRKYYLRVNSLLQNPD